MVAPESHFNLHKQSILKRIEYYTRELQHGYNICNLFRSNNDNDYYNSLVQYLKTLKRCLIKLRISLLKPDHDSFRKSFIIEKVLFLIPKALHNILISALQRKHRPIKHFSIASFQTYTFSEAHPTYSTEIMAIEKINRYFSLVINRLIKFSIPTPIVCLSDRSRYAYLLFEDNTGSGNSSTGGNTYFINIDKTADNVKISESAFSKNVIEYLSPAQVLMPRWGPTDIKYSIFIAHEQFHRLMSQVRICILNLLQKIKSDRDQKLEEPPLRFESLYGEGIYKLAVTYFKLYKEYNKLVDELKSKHYFRKQHLDERKPYHQLIEICCDLGGIYFGPVSYVCSFLIDLYNKNMPDADKVFDSEHPPDPIRLYILIEIMKDLEYNMLTSKIEQIFGGDYKEICLEKYPEYLNWFHENKPLFLDYMAVLSAYCGTIKTEAEYIKACEDIIEKINNNEVYLYDYNPAEILNALWYKYIFEEQKANDNIPWLLAFKYCLLTQLPAKEEAIG
jgi:hypothetical protein